MYKKIFCLAALFTMLLNMSLFAFPEGSTTLSGKVTDKQTGSTIPGAVIYIPDLKTGSITNADGIYIIGNLPQKKILVQVSFTGYKTIIESIDLSQTSVKDFILEVSVKELNEVIITGHSKAGEKNRNPTPITTISKSDLQQNASVNIIDAIAKQPGLSQITTGSGISKPVIRGLGFNRVVVVNDGIRQEGQQWGDEHGIEIDEFSVNKVEIIKGPSSLSYGSDAIAGVINMFSETAIPQGTITGGVVANYQTNNGLAAYSFNVAGNVKSILWNMRYSSKTAHSYKNRFDGYVYNSGYKENSVSGILGLNRSWGYSHLHLSMYEINPGLVEGDRDSATGKFLKPVVINDSTEGQEIADGSDLLTYDIGIPNQKIIHYKAILNNNFIIGNGSVKAVLAFQQNQRNEYGNVLDPDEEELSFKLNTINYDLRYIFPEVNGLDVSAGINGMQQSSYNLGTEFVVPAYSLFDIGAFAIVKKSYKKLDLSGGLRYDIRNESVKELLLNSEGIPTSAIDTSGMVLFKAFNANFSGFSGSIGATYQFSEKLFTKFNIAKGYRAPNIAELGSNGVHEGTQRYELGNSSLKAESSFQVDLAIGLNTEHISAELDLFSSFINDYIFSRKLINASGSDSLMDDSSVFQFVSGDAEIKGGEFMIDIHPHPLDWLHFENSFSYVEAIQKGQPDSAKYLPYIPAARFQSELRADIKNTGKILNNTFIKFGIEYSFAQNKYYAAYNTETATPAYLLMNAGVGTTLMGRKNPICSIYINVNNIADIGYQNHLSRLKYTSLNYSSGRTGVFNMGRNISFKLIVPLELKK